MEIVNFFEKLAGRWFSQRTTHALSTKQSKAGKSDLEVEFLSADNPDVTQLCAQAATGGVPPLCGLRIKQSSTIDGDTTAKVQTTLLVPLTPTSNSQSTAQSGEDTTYSGVLLRSGTDEQSAYTLEEEVLTIVSDSPAAHSEERLWFVSDNLRMRTGVTALSNGLRIASFCSEIRLGAVAPSK
jgi:hypothetical protein